jgi:hypothetical protein
MSQGTLEVGQVDRMYRERIRWCSIFRSDFNVGALYSCEVENGGIRQKGRALVHTCSIQPYLDIGPL